MIMAHTTWGLLPSQWMTPLTSKLLAAFEKQAGKWATFFNQSSKFIIASVLLSSSMSLGPTKEHACSWSTPSISMLWVWTSAWRWWTYRKPQNVFHLGRSASTNANVRRNPNVPYSLGDVLLYTMNCLINFNRVRSFLFNYWFIIEVVFLFCVLLWIIHMYHMHFIFWLSIHFFTVQIFNRVRSFLFNYWSIIVVVFLFCILLWIIHMYHMHFIFW